MKKCLTHSPRLDNTRVANEGHQILPFAVADTANKRPFANGCKGALCGPAQQKALGFYIVSAIREPSPTIARACYIRNVGAL